MATTMDYGKLAYIKSQEIEEYLRLRATAPESGTSASASFYPHSAFDGGYEPCTLSAAKGNAGLSVAVAVSAPLGAQAVKVRLYCGEKLAAYVTVTLPQNGSGRYYLLASVTPGSGEKLRLAAETNELLLDEISVLAQGSGVKLTTGGGGYKCDSCGGGTFTVNENSRGYIILSKCGEDASATVSHGSVFDVAATETGVKVLCSDDNRNLWGVCYDFELNELSRVFLGDGAARVALAKSAGGLFLACVRGRKLYFAECDENFLGLTEWVPANFEAEADDVFLSKQTDFPALFFSRNGTLYAKIPKEAFSVRDGVSVSLSLELL